MGKPTVQQIAGLNIVDWLYFNQTLVRAVMDHEVLAWFIEIVEHVKTAVAATGTSGMEAEIMKHYVLCFLEILVSDDCADAGVEKLQQYNKDFFFAMLIAISRLSRNDSLSEAIEITYALADNVLSAPAVVRVRLAERCLAVEYETAAHEGFMWLVKAGAIPCAKFRGTDVRQHATHEAVVARIGLLCEFEWARFHFREVQKNISLARHKFDFIANTLPTDQKQMITEARDLWVEKYFGDMSRAFPKGFDVGRQSDKYYVVDYLKRVHSHWSRQRFCVGTLASWVSNFGALSIMILKSIDDPRPIYIEENKNSADTLAEDAKNTMLSYGMTIHARSLYMRYRKFTTTMIPRIKVYYQAIQIGPGVLSAEEEDPFYQAMLEFPCDNAGAIETQGAEPKLEITMKNITQNVSSDANEACVN